MRRARPFKFDHNGRTSRYEVGQPATSPAIPGTAPIRPISLFRVGRFGVDADRRQLVEALVPTLTTDEIEPRR